MHAAARVGVYVCVHVGSDFLGGSWMFVVWRGVLTVCVSLSMHVATPVCVMDGCDMFGVCVCA